jgi:peptide/nickel transport system permease protein
VLVVTLVAPFLAPAPPDLQEDVAGARFLPPMSRAHAIRTADDPERVLVVVSLRRTSIGWRFDRAGVSREIPAADLLEPPSPRLYLLGTDALGRDLASRLLFASRRSVGIALASVALALLLGVGAGSLAGLTGGWRDSVLMRGVDVLMSIPRLLLFLVCTALLTPTTPVLIAVLGATTWTGIARIVRAEMLSLRGSDLADAARALGASAPRLVVHHLLPQIVPVIAVSAALRFADTVLLESALGFLGLSSPPPAVSLGSVIASGRDALAEAWWIVLWPGLVIAILVITARVAASGILRRPEPSSTT